ncbi:glucose-6-phosphate isomerase [Acetilactobacillus jinshanensis]|uniref:Glucose-6-phosphate isomerase n=1 Tax=Acetilactobacillus jinshanensis TaxID=1720083 RepID=A0A4P6ZM21_9LACO|nr:glucose-6-phosphate isomerase [Acetilactobacillus jinshanensis]QBP18462.1 glucose-6-phosphate isomerase [Acetilactobacillus jinshanensis]URL61333.1 glucose-6-phosphate isomerase [uncultured bacterium]
MTAVSFNNVGLKKYVKPSELKEIEPMIDTAESELMNGTGVGSEMRQWLDLPKNYDRKEFEAIKQAAKKIRSDSKILVVIGIGGSYLGARMAIDFLHDSFFNYMPDSRRKDPQVIFAGNSLSASYVHSLIDMIGDRDFSVNVVSKSGTTTEPTIAFRIFRKLLVKKYGAKEAADRIYVSTDAKHGALRQEVKAKGYHSYVIPDGIGGRYSVLCPVGLLPIAVSGVDIDKLMGGAAQAESDLTSHKKIADNDALKYAAYRNILYRKGYTNEIFESYEPNMRYLAEWWKQLAGETEGKDNKGIYPTSACLSTDLHSLGQYIQQGMRNLMETVVKVENAPYNETVPSEKSNLDELGYLQGHTMNFANKKALQAVVIAHTNGGVPDMIVDIKDQTPFTLGYLIYYFEFAIAVSGYLNGINPFNQPGVEDYKNNMFALLGKPGYENLRKEIEAHKND